MMEKARSSPYRGILPFRYADRDYFFGREREVNDLTAKILLYRLVVLFGDSGSGKSSLINAGVVPKLQQNGLQPERLRVRPFEETPIMIERIASGVKEPWYLPSIFSGCSLESQLETREISCSLESLIRILSQKKNEQASVLIFDQFEELFTLFEPSHRALQRKILDVIEEAVNRRDLVVKLLVGIREDFIGKLELLAQRYPQVFDRRVLLGLLSPEAAQQAIIGPFQGEHSFKSRMTNELADSIVSDFCRDNENIGIHPTQLQIVCSRLWNEYAGGEPAISSQHFNEMGGVKGILEGFLESETSRLPEEKRALAYIVLGQLITSTGTRDVVSEDRLKEWVSQDSRWDEASLAFMLKFLEEQRLINRTPQRGTYYYEVSSEYLIAPIQRYNRVRESSEAERKAAEQATEAEREKARTRELEQAQLLAEEKTRVAEAESKKAELMVRSERRLKKRLIAMVFLFIAAVSLAFFSLKQTREAINMRALADQERRRAEDEALALKLANERAFQQLEAFKAELDNIQRRASEFSPPTKWGVEAFQEKIMIKQSAFSGDPDRIQSAISRSPSGIRFAVKAVPLGQSSPRGPVYRFEMFPRGETIQGGIESLALVTLYLNHPSFKNSIIAAGPDRDFRCSYEGWGCLNSVVAVIEYKDPKRRTEATRFDMCELLKQEGKLFNEK